MDEQKPSTQSHRSPAQRPKTGFAAWQTTLGYISRTYSPDAMLKLQTHFGDDDHIRWSASVSWGPHFELVADCGSLADAFDRLWRVVEANHEIFQRDGDILRAPKNYDEQEWLDVNTLDIIHRFIWTAQGVFGNDWQLLIVYQPTEAPNTRLQMRLLAQDNAVRVGARGPRLMETCRALFRNAIPVFSPYGGHISKETDMMVLDTSIFRKYDIRGLVTGEAPQITPELARLVGQALGTYLPQQFGTDYMYVGSDNRPTSGPLKAAMIEGIASSGMNVTDIGQVLTPTLYFAVASHGEKGGGVMITGSHLDTRYNGIKMAYGTLALAGDQIQDLLKIIQDGSFAQGKGQVDSDLDMIHKHMSKLGTMVKLERSLNVVLDAGNGLSGTYVPPLLEKLGANVTCLYCESDGTYPNHLPNPEDPETTKDLEAKVVEIGADLGLGFDGDSDRCGFIDNHGHHIAADRLLALLARDLLGRMPGASIVFDVKASQALPDEIKKYGGKPVMWKTGHSLMKQKMREIDSPLGGEVSGHLFIGENYYGFDDAPLVALKALEIISRSDKSISEIFDEIPKLQATPEIIIQNVPDNLKFGIIEELTTELSGAYEVITVDGVRTIFENGWGLVRASNTQPAITLRFEAYEKPQIVEYMKRFKGLLQKHPEVDLTKLNDQIERFSS